MKYLQVDPAAPHSAWVAREQLVARERVMRKAVRIRREVIFAIVDL
jgi:hypothetical protein